jgi:hypothetical protein
MNRAFTAGGFALLTSGENRRLPRQGNGGCVRGCFSQRGASPLFERGKSLQPDPGGLIDGRAIGNRDRLDLDCHMLDRAGK